MNLGFPPTQMKIPGKHNELNPALKMVKIVQALGIEVFDKICPATIGPTNEPMENAISLYFGREKIKPEISLFLKRDRARVGNTYWTFQIREES